jgi:uncharacterized protein
MRWASGHVSSNVEDRRGQRMGYAGGGGGGALTLASLLIGRGKWGTLIGLAILAFVFLGPRFMSTSQVTETAPGTTATAPMNDEPKQFVGFVLDDAQTTWHRLLPQYRDAQLVLFTDATRTACGTGQAAAGPFYCPADEKVYIDLSFYNELSRRFGASGDFAQAYVIGHEIGHHVQKVTGTPKVGNARDRAIATELQADCYAGVWAHSTNQRQLLEAGDVDEALTAAAAVGDDSIQRKTTGVVRLESWTHGSAADRKRWFRRGFDTGDPRQCDTFGSLPQ